MPGDGQSPGSQPAESLGIAEIVVAILEARKTKPWATAASISRERRHDTLYVRVALLEGPSAATANRPGGQSAHGEVVAAFTVRRLDEDLAVAFGQKDVIILK
jgi:hypothetical protein